MFVVRRRQFGLLLAALLVAGVSLGGGAWWILHKERTGLEAALSSITAQRDKLASENSAITEQRDALSRQLSIIDRSAQVKSQAYAKVDAQLEELQRQILDLKEDVAFYRGIVSEDSAGNRLRIQRLVVEQEGDERDYRFRVVLTRGKRDDKVVDGALSLFVDGDRDGERVRLTLEQLGALSVANLQFSFKHFQRLEGRLHLPDRFVPKRVVIQIDSANSKTKPVRESFAWSVVNS